MGFARVSKVSVSGLLREVYELDARISGVMSRHRFTGLVLDAWRKRAIFIGSTSNSRTRRQMRRKIAVIANAVSSLDVEEVPFPSWGRPRRIRNVIDPVKRRALVAKNRSMAYNPEMVHFTSATLHLADPVQRVIYEMRKAKATEQEIVQYIDQARVALAKEIEAELLELERERVRR